VPKKHFHSKTGFSEMNLHKIM